MLTEIRCDKFVSNGQPREPIEFHPGLNVVLGDDNGSNSIGKSTFLMILDFVFGGKDYIKKNKDVQENIGEHNICFSFDFEDEKYYFSRNTVHYMQVQKCDEKYQPLANTEPLSLDAYNDFLMTKYSISKECSSWRGAVSRFIRVYKRETLNENLPLKSATSESAENAIKSFMKLWSRYEIVEEQINAANQVADERDAFNRAQRYNQIRSARNKTEFEENNKRIKSLQDKEQELAKNSNDGLLNLDGIQAQRLSELQAQIVHFQREAAQVQHDLNNVRRDMTGEKKSFRNGFGELERFFPNEDFRSLEEIEAFHKRLSKVLQDEYKDAERNLATSYMTLNNEIVRLKEEVASIKKIPNVSAAILKEYARIMTELNNLQEANKNYEEHERLNKVAKEYAENRDNVIKDQLFAIQSAINQEMRAITNQILGKGKQSPILRLEGLTKYSFETPNDGGTGAQFRGVITFDLANLRLTTLPFIVHDSVVLKNLSKDTLAKIVKQYASFSSQEGMERKQIFISYDSLDSYDADTEKIMKDHAVLELSPNGNELFGWPWNKEAETK